MMRVARLGLAAIASLAVWSVSWMLPAKLTFAEAFAWIIVCAFVGAGSGAFARDYLHDRAPRDERERFVPVRWRQ